MMSPLGGRSMGAELLALLDEAVVAQAFKKIQANRVLKRANVFMQELEFVTVQIGFSGCGRNGRTVAIAITVGNIFALLWLLTIIISVVAVVVVRVIAF